LEKPLELGQSLKKGRHLDIEAELELANEFIAKFMKQHSGSDSSQKLEKVAMKELGFKTSTQIYLSIIMSISRISTSNHALSWFRM